MAKNQPASHKKIWTSLGLVVFLLVVLAASWLAYIFAASPNAIRNPYLQHYHFRLQILVNGKLVDFGSAKFQTPESNASCDVALPATPIHFHDNKNQIVHVHWDSITGGLFLKDYGWNYIGGIDGALGYRFDDLLHIKKVPIHGNDLPAVPGGNNFYVYSGGGLNYKQRAFNDFLHQDLEVFFDHPSSLPASKPKTSLLNWFAPTAYAQQVNDTGADLTSPQLEQLNNLIGNAVIFVQKTKPTDAQVKERFNHLEPLSKSVCGS
jgi:hypothetical protein